MSRPGEGGYSVVELLVSAVVLTLVLFMGTQLLLESQWVYQRAAAEMENPDLRLALVQLRNDLHSSAAVKVSRLTSGWSRDRLDLVNHPAGQLRYEKVGTDLERITGNGAAQRTVLKNVTRWRWRVTVAGLVEVEIRHRLVRPALGSQLVDSPLRRPTASEQRLHRLLVSPRAARRTGW